MKMHRMNAVLRVDFHPGFSNNYRRLMAKGVISKGVGNRQRNCRAEEI